MSANGPRLEPLPYDRWESEAQAVLPRYLRRPEIYLSGGPDAQPMPRALGLFAHQFRLGAAWMEFTNFLVGEHTELEPHYRELAILRVAWLTRSEYEWLQHVRIGAQAGLTTEQLYAVAQGAGAQLWTPLEQAVIAATDSIIDDWRIDDASWQTLAAHLDSAQILELLFVVGAYVCFASVANSVDLQPDPPTEPVDAPTIARRTSGG